MDVLPHFIVLQEIAGIKSKKGRLSYWKRRKKAIGGPNLAFLPKIAPKRGYYELFYILFYM